VFKTKKQVVELCIVQTLIDAKLKTGKRGQKAELNGEFH
jgi:hypothetical protein